MQGAKPDGPGAANDVQKLGDKIAQMEIDTKVEAQKKKVKKTNVPVSEAVCWGLAASEVQKAVEKEFEMALQDRVMEETKDTECNRGFRFLTCRTRMLKTVYMRMARMRLKSIYC